MAVKSLNTRYAGCHFRSRLEARCAVYFNALGIAWEYEPQGFAVTHRLTGGFNFDDTFNYLPDFWLPGLGVWAEVKGELDRTAAIRLLDAAASLSSDDDAGCGSGHDLAVFGPLTSSTLLGTPIRLHMHKGSLIGTCLWCNDRHGWGSGSRQQVEVGYDDSPPDFNIPDRIERSLLTGFACFRHVEAHKDAYRAARSARFEFGRSGR